jgi:hypothetical protein
MTHITIKINKEHTNIVHKYGICQTIGGYSNLNKSDLSKASRLEYQYTGIYGELAWHLYRRGNTNTLVSLLEHKFATLRPAGKGDNGFDDSITANGKTRLVDIKTSHVEDIAKIQYLNLVIPQREYHQNMIYVCAFTVGKNRSNVDSVILAGWEINECINKRWKYDSAKWCVPVKDLRQMEELDEYIR